MPEHLGGLVNPCLGTQLLISDSHLSFASLLLQEHRNIIFRKGFRIGQMNMLSSVSANDCNSDYYTYLKTKPKQTNKQKNPNNHKKPKKLSE